MGRRRHPRRFPTLGKNRTAIFENLGRRERHVDHVLNGAEVMGDLARHAAALRPLSAP